MSVHMNSDSQANTADQSSSDDPSAPGGRLSAAKSVKTQYQAALQRLTDLGPLVDPQSLSAEVDMATLDDLEGDIATKLADLAQLRGAVLASTVPNVHDDTRGGWTFKLNRESQVAPFTVTDHFVVSFVTGGAFSLPLRKFKESCNDQTTVRIPVHSTCRMSFLEMDDTGHTRSTAVMLDANLTCTIWSLGWSEGVSDTQ